MRHLSLFFLGMLIASSSMVSAEDAEASPFQLISLNKDEPIIFEEDTIDVGDLLSFDPDFLDVGGDLLEPELKHSSQVELAQAEEAGALSSSLEEEDSFEISDLEREEVFDKPAIAQVRKKELIDAHAARKIEEKSQKSTVASINASGKRAVVPADKTTDTLQINLGQVFAGSPVIYSLLLSLSVLAFFICLYNWISLRGTSDSFVRKVRQKLLSNQFDEALALCLKNEQLFGRVLSAAISVRKLGLAHMVETMKTEGKRATVGFWQRISLLNDIAIVAPMLGLLGTVLGMFYAFYDLNRSTESVNTLFDGLGISVGTTVAGLVVAIIAMMLHSLAKYRLVRVLTFVEDEAQALAIIMDPKTTFSSEK